MGHTYSNLLLHVVFSTKQRRPLIHEAFRQRLYEYMGGLARKEFGQAVIVGGTENHIHALLSIRTDVSVADAMRKLKALSSGWVRRLDSQRGDFAWQSGYSAFSVSESQKERVVAYINRQVEHHKQKTFEEEFAELLRRHGIQYDPTQALA